MRSAVLIALVAAACASAAPPSAAPAPPAEQPPPWSAAALARSEVPPVYLAQWNRADNRATCAPFALAPQVAGPNATARAATFGGGWGVAYDLPTQRSAFGIAGTGVAADADGIYSDWPFRKQWADGSSVGYGPEGGTGSNQLAYLRIAGQGCLYNVWSRLGREHLESLLAAIRRVEISR